MSMPRNPLTLEEHQRRYPAALATIFDVEEITLGTAKRPGECPECVFDFADGMRLIVSRERVPDGEIVVHVSASFDPGSELFKAMERGRMGPHEFCREVSRRFNLMTCTKDGLLLLGFSKEMGVPHFRVIPAAEAGELVKHGMAM